VVLSLCARESLGRVPEGLGVTAEAASDDLDIALVTTVTNELDAPLPSRGPVREGRNVEPEVVPQRGPDG
jgi:hypothetical protein